MHDFQLGTRIADAVAAAGDESFFPDLKDSGEWSADMVIIDLDDDALASLDLIRQIKSESERTSLVGTARRVSKQLRDGAVGAGCSWVFTKSSLPKNLSSVLDNID